jgi:chromosome segregation ATPase
MNHVFYESSCKLQEALREVEKIDSITKDPSIYINQHFDDCHVQINSRRKSLIKDVNDYSDKLIRENESNRSQCLQNSAKTEELAKKIDFLKEEIFDLKKQFDTFDKSVTQLRWERNKILAVYLKDRLSETLNDYKESLLLNNRLSFVCFYLPIEDIFGKMFDRNEVY